MPSADPTVAPVSQASRLDRVLLFGLLILATYSYPLFPLSDLDSSWRMALGKFLLDGRQFGTEVVFTYGPLGFLMGKTYYGSGTLFKLMLVWQAFASVGFVLLIMMWGERLAGWPRRIFYGFFLLFGVCYDDALHMFALVLIGMELIRRSGGPRHWTSVLMVSFAAVLAVVKFTNLVLALALMAVVAAYEFTQRRPRQALYLFAWFAVCFVGVWLLCGQNPLNLVAYVRNGWDVSQGYQQAMGIPTPPAPLWKALVIVGLLAVYLVHNFFTHPDRARTVAYSATLGAFLFLNWKHGFVRSDGHMIGFFYCAMLPVVAFPALLADGGSWRRLKRGLLVSAGILGMWGCRDALPGIVDYALGIFQNKLWSNVSKTAHLATLRGDYNVQLEVQRQAIPIPRTEAVVEDHSVDVMGYDQYVALFKKLNYVPRPVLQSYSAYTPRLAKLNADFYASDRAPDFVMLRVQSIDGRLPGMDDSAALYLIAHRYTYVLVEKGYELWRKRPGPFDAAALAPRPLAARSLALDDTWVLDEYVDRHLWATIDLPASWLGRLRAFFYKPPIVQLAVEDTAGNKSTYRLPIPLGRAGFVLSPMIEDTLGFLNFAANRPERRVRKVALQVAPEDRKYFAAKAEISLATLVPPAGEQHLASVTRTGPFRLFSQVPAAYDSPAVPSEEFIDGLPAIIVHAPSEITFNLEPGTATVQGRYGFLSNAYRNGGKTNGADFWVIWSDGKDTVELHHRFLDPVREPEDRSLQSFRVDVSKFHGGRVYLRIGPGPFNDTGWDWTGWTDIKFSDVK